MEKKKPIYPEEPDNIYRNYVLGMLTLVYVFNFIDRQLLVILQESIKKELHLSDTQLGLLSGFTFAIFYVTLGVPIARVADKAGDEVSAAYIVGKIAEQFMAEGIVPGILDGAAPVGIGMRLAQLLVRRTREPRQKQRSNRIVPG